MRRSSRLIQLGTRVRSEKKASLQPSTSEFADAKDLLQFWCSAHWVILWFRTCKALLWQCCERWKSGYNTIQHDTTRYNTIQHDNYNRNISGSFRYMGGISGLNVLLWAPSYANCSFACERSSYETSVQNGNVVYRKSVGNAKVRIGYSMIQ